MPQIAERRSDAAPSFVGRDRELAELLGGLEDAMAGRGRLFLVGGEPGIGKSALTEQLAESARQRGAHIASGRCWESGGAPPYWPWVQSMRALLDELDETALQPHLGTFRSDLAQMLPEIGSRSGVEAGTVSPDPDAARFRLFDATAAFLRSVARERPIVVTLEDIHAADTPSLLLLEFVARTLASSRLLIVATYRDVEVARGHPLASLLPELARESVTRRLTLAGIRRADVEQFIEQSAGIRPNPGLVEAVHRETDGNPLFVGEIVRLLVSEGRLQSEGAAAIKPIPQSIRNVIARRVNRVSEQCNQVLGIASVLGREFTLDVLERLADRTADELLGVLDEAIDTRLVTEPPGVLGGLRFSHSLIRDVLYEEMPRARRVRLHRRAGEILERIREGHPDHLAEIAHHYFAAAAAGNAEKAVEFATLAAEHALRRLAFEEAARLFEMALQAMQLGGVPDEATRQELLLALADALTRAGDSESAREHAYAAAQIARRREDAEGLGRAALLYGGSFAWGALRGDARFVPLLEDALSALTRSGTSPALRLKLMGRLAAGPWRDLPETRRRMELISQAIEEARDLDDPGTLAYVLDARLSANQGPVDLEPLVEVADELERVATSMNDAEKILMAHMWRLVAHMYRGQMAQVFAERDAIAGLAERLRQGPQNWFLLATDAELAFFVGRFADAEQLAIRAYESGRRTEPYALFAFRVQMLWIRMEQARQHEVATEFRDALERFRVYPAWRAIAPNLLLAYSTESEARAAFHAVFPQPRPLNEEYLLASGVLAEAAASLEEREAALSMYDELLPFAALTMGGIPDINIGATSRVLGRLAHVLDRLDDAEKHFLDAIEANNRTGGRPWAAWAQYAYAELLMERNGRGDHERAATLLAQAQATASDLGMAALERKIAGAEWAGAVAAVPIPPGAPIAARGIAPRRLRREGEYWTIGFAGTSFRLRDTKGIHYLARLLREPGREFLALDLVRDISAGPVPAERGDVPDDLRPALGDTGAALDEQAKSAYRARLHELQAELDEAESWHDAERAERARDEMEFIARELAHAVGLGGRDRVVGSATERARLSVTRAIRLAMKRIAVHHRTLAEHLEGSIHTGTYCAYRPDPGLSVEWEIG